MRNTNSAIALDAEFIRLMKSGKPLYMRISNADNYPIGSVHGVKETFRADYFGNVDYITETRQGNPAGWHYSNSMPLSFVKRYVIVTDLKHFTVDEYKDLPFADMETTYNRLPFYIEGVGYNRPLRTGGHAKPPEKDFFIVKFETLYGFESVVEDTY